jgi:hypothetical protein
MGRVKHELLGAYELWTEDMPDLMGQALADAEREFLENHARHHAIAAALRNRDSIDEADNMPLWIQLELDLWENMQGYGGECDL